MQIYTEIKPSHKAILFFAGWGMDSNPFRHLEHKGYDLFIMYDYSTLVFDTCPENEKCTPQCKEICIMQQLFSRYQEVSIVGWGLGVWCASAAFDKYLIRLSHMGHFSELKFWAKVKRCIAINGTPMPLSKVWGITPHSYLKTMELLPQKDVMEKFLHRMCHSKKEYDFYMANAPQRDPQHAKMELCTIYRQLFISNSITWDTSIIGDNDIIFKSSRQKTFWDSYSAIAPDGYIPGTRRKFSHRIVEIPGSHYLFNRFGSWEEILQL